MVFPQLQFTTPTDNKALLVVGNYGTGKSHLMAVISALAEHSELVSELTNDAVAEAAAESAGHFQVIRAEAPSTQLALRDLSMHFPDQSISRLRYASSTGSRYTASPRVTSSRRWAPPPKNSVTIFACI